MGVLAHHRVDIAGEPVDLPVLSVGEHGAIVLLNVLDHGAAFIRRAGEALAERLAAARPEVVLGTATLGIPVAVEVSRALGLDRFVIAQKSPKVYLDDPLTVPLVSSTTAGAQHLYVDRANVPLLAGRRVAVVDDVAASGASLAAALALARAAGGRVAAVGVVLTEGNAWRERLGEDARLLVRLGHIPRYRVGEGGRLEVVADSL
ncbi:MAG: adenine phosphoribosyltransferase [Firmicutes bacterium]|nr:adenine phosphoribosyltransferase [Bacillota bacterium]